jgi:hypothetical protein
VSTEADHAGGRGTGTRYINERADCRPFEVSRMIDKREVLDMSLSLGTARRAMWGVLAGSLLVLLGACSTASGGGATSSSSPSPAHSSTVIVGDNPQDSALNPLTHADLRSLSLIVLVMAAR